MKPIYSLLSTSFREKLQDLHKKYPSNQIINDILNADYIIESNKNSFSEENSKQLKLLITDFGRLITFRENSELISFLPKDKTPIYNENGQWSVKNRQCGKPAKFFQKLLVHKYTCKEFEDFSNLIKYEILKSFVFQIVTGEDIRKYYNEEFYYKSTGTLGGSCMRHLSCQSYFDIYVDNAQMLVAFKQGKVIGRALLWTLKDGSIFMDRIYGCFDWIETTFVQYAKEHKWIIRKDNDVLHDRDYLFVYSSESDYKNEYAFKEEIQLNKTYTKYPYMDSFRYLNTESNTIKSYPENFHRVLNYTTGELPKQITFVCGHCGRTETIDCTDDTTMFYSCANDCYYCEECSWYCDMLSDFYDIDDKITVYTISGNIAGELPLSWLESAENNEVKKENDKWIIID